jgi:hypothetical protein
MRNSKFSGEGDSETRPVTTIIAAPGAEHPVPSPSTVSAPAQDTAARPVQDWIEEINLACGYCTSGVIETGDLLLQAKHDLPHGQWMSMFESGKLKFGPRMAQMHMAVARHPTLRNSKYFSDLPSAWSILHVLSKLPPEVVEQEILSGAIHPELRLREAQRLLQGQRGDAHATAAGSNVPPFDLERQRKGLQGYLGRQRTRWPAEHHEELAALLESIVAELRAGRNAL